MNIECENNSGCPDNDENPATLERCVTLDVCNTVCKTIFPVAEYHLEGDASDSSGNENNGDVLNGVLWVQGIVGTAAEFDGVDDYISIPDSDSLRIPGSWTISAWVNLDTLPPLDKAMTIVGKGMASETEGENHNYLLAIENDVFSTGNGATALLEDSGGTNYFAKVGTTLETGKWHHVAGVYDTNTNSVYFYLNGNQLASTQADLTVDTGIPCVTMGTGNCNTPTVWDTPLDGKIDEVFIYNKPLTPTEIEILASRM
jgi:hypothetical protein